MKKVIAFIVLSALAITITSAVILDDSKKEHEVYCLVVGTRALLSNKVTIQVDYGEPKKWFTDQRIKDESGKVEKFNSMIDALNYMAENDWKFVCAYPLTVQGNLVYHYTFKKTVNEEGE